MPLVEIHPHASERAPERGVSEEEIVETVRTGESFPVKFGRMGEAIAVEISDGWLVLTVIARYF